MEECFNPRAPRGARPPFFPRGFVLEEFQSTRPARGATSPNFPGKSRFRFQSTRPARGATMANAVRIDVIVFQSTRPARGATPRIGTGRGNTACFNPRAPRGARPEPYRALLRGVMFQSTRPARGATIDFYSIGLNVTSGLIPRTWGNIRMSESGADLLKLHHPKPQLDALRANRLGFCGELGVRGGQKISVSVTSTCSVFPRCSMRFSQLAPRK